MEKNIESIVEGAIQGAYTPFLLYNGIERLSENLKSLEYTKAISQVITAAAVGLTILPCHLLIATGTNLANCAYKTYKKRK